MSEIVFNGRVPLAAASQVTEGFRRGRKGMPIWALVLIVGTGLGIVGYYKLRHGNEDGGIEWLAYAAICLFVGGALWLGEERAMTRKSWDLQYRGRVTDQGIQLDGKTQSVLFPWTSFARVEQHENLVIGWLRSGRAVPLASEMFADETLFQTASAQIASHIGSHGP
jgi:hypothetical protein